ncbi:NAD(P)-dependent alcohol dehydrogenase [Carboxylicivirga sp. RSCT41]|uniref:NAD(P)-dependent alcohol dehydrogenase n=1 Tax=Carboxylicivirga agarovorans TaxID=3417570 RepID=UPI003D34EEA2
MKAIEYNRYGGPEVLQLKEVEKPGPADNEVLIKIHATTVTATECNFRRGEPLMARMFTGMLKPRLTRLGEEMAGEVVEVGKAVTRFKPGNKVFGTAGPGFGANAEFISLPEDGVITALPENISYSEAAASVDGFLTAMPFLRDTGRIKRGHKVLINGASGSVGTAAVQVARYFGAEVTGVCSHGNMELVRSLGATRVIDYTREDFTKGNETYDLVFDTVGKIAYKDAKRVLKKNGTFLEAGIGFGIIPHVLWSSLFTRQKARIAATGLRSPREKEQDLNLLKNLMEEEIIKPVIDRSYPLSDIVEAHRYVDTGRKRGNVVVELSNC